MAIYTNLPVYGEAYKLMLTMVEMSLHFKRDFRYTMGEDVKRCVMEILKDIYRANRSTEKTRHIADAREQIVEVKVYLRILTDLKQISDKRYLELAQVTESISKQLSAWEKSCR